MLRPRTHAVNPSHKPLVVTDPHPRSIDLIFDTETKARLERLATVAWHDGPPAPRDWVDEHLSKAVALIGQCDLPKERLDRAPNLKIVFNVESNFLPNIDYAECHRRGIHVVSTAPVFMKPVAEMALGLALAAARRIPQADAAIRAGNESLYGTEDNFDSILLSGRTLGLVGCGNLGRALVPLLRPFGSIVAHDPWVHASTLQEMGLEAVSLDECFARSSVVFVLAAATTENAGRIGRRHFEAMPHGAIVVLVSRAAVVNFDELVAAAAAGRIRAAIDVWPEEPIPKGHPARSAPNTILQAHRAGNIPEIWPWMGRMVVDDLELVLQGLAPQRCQRASLETVSRIRSKPVS